jgi:hypothetical protein
LSLGSGPGRAYYKFLVVTLLIELLKESSGRLAPELTLILRAKVCRRLAKLEQDKDLLPDLYSKLFAVVTPFFKSSLEEVTEAVNAAWEKFKRETKRSVPRLPRYADQDAQYLSLPNSSEHLQSVLQLRLLKNRAPLSLKLPARHDGTVEQFEQFTDLYHSLAKLESMICTKDGPEFSEEPSLEARCKLLSDAMFNIFDSVGTAYDSDPEQISMFILCLFILWVRLDQCIVIIFPLLRDYHPVFTPELLKTLHLPNTEELERLKDIQDYIRSRCDASKHKTSIFSKPTHNSFTVKSVNESEDMLDWVKKIQVASKKSRVAKKAELKQWCKEYDEHSASVNEGTCICKVLPDGSRDVRGCTKCWHWRVRNRMQILAHEDYLPDDDAKAAAIVFELRIPETIDAYRNATWKILKLAHPTKPTHETSAKLLEEYQPLRVYGKRDSACITMASTSKSFLGTHYKVARERMKATELDVLVPHGLDFSYFDSVSHAWIEDFDKPLTFQHVCGIRVPPGLRNTILPKTVHPPTETDEPSSNEIIASEAQCPSSMSAHEFTACQRLISGKTRRWLTMLVELGASDINFNSESIMQMFNDLSNQAGPSLHEPDTLRFIHPSKMHRFVTAWPHKSRLACATLHPTGVKSIAWKS